MNIRFTIEEENIVAIYAEDSRERTIDNINSAIALLVGMVLFVVNEADRVENQVIMQMIFIDVSCQNKLILAA